MKTIAPKSRLAAFVGGGNRKDAISSQRAGLRERIGRRALRALKPFLLPLLHRYGRILQAALERTAIGSIDARIAALEAQLTTMQTAIAQMDEKLDDALGHSVMSNSGRSVIAQLDAKVDRLLQGQVVPVGAGNLAVRSPFGYILIPSGDAALVAYLTSGRPHEPGTYAVLDALLKPGATMVDVGSHVGLFTLFAARRVGPGGHVVAVEPTPAIAALLRQTLEINGVLDRVDLYEAAAGATADRRKLYLGRTAGENSLYPGSGYEPGPDVQILPLDDIIFDLEAISVVKIDAEGAELDVLRGMRRTLAKNPRLPVVVEFGPSHLRRAGVDIADWFAEIREMGFEPWEIDEEARAVRPLRQAGLASVHSLNLLLLRASLSDFPSLPRA